MFRRKLTGPFQLFFALVTALALSAGCKKEEPQPSRVGAETVAKSAGESKGKKELVVYSGRSEKLVAPVIAKFEKNLGIDVKVKYGNSAQLAATLLAEGANSPAEVFWAQDVSTIGFLDAKGVLAPLPESVLAKVLQAARGPQKTWIGTSARSRVLAYHKGKLAREELPKSVFELTKAPWRGRVGWAPENASFQSFVAAMIQLEGADKSAEWLKAMKANQPKDYPKNTPAVLAISKGEIDVALVNHYYLYRLRSEHGADFPVANYYFKNGAAESLLNLSAVAVLKGAKSQKAALAFIEFLVGEGGQSHFVGKNYEFPVAKIPPALVPKGLPELAALRVPKVDLTKLSNLEETVKLLRSTGVLK